MQLRNLEIEESVLFGTPRAVEKSVMVFYAGKLVINEELENPTIVIITDRNDLDDQLYGTFLKSKDILRSTPVKQQIDSSEGLVK